MMLLLLYVYIFYVDYAYKVFYKIQVNVHIVVNLLQNKILWHYLEKVHLVLIGKIIIEDQVKLKKLWI